MQPLRQITLRLLEQLADEKDTRGGAVALVGGWEGGREGERAGKREGRQGKRGLEEVAFCLLLQGADGGAVAVPGKREGGGEGGRDEEQQRAAART